MGEGYDAIFSPLSVVDANLARMKIDVRQSNINSLTRMPVYISVGTIIMS